MRLYSPLQDSIHSLPRQSLATRSSCSSHKQTNSTSIMVINNAMGVAMPVVALVQCEAHPWKSSLQFV
jgi:poly(A) polymerase Pap1